MQGDIFGFAGNALGSASHLILLLFIASLVIALLVRLGVSVFATDRVKERKQAEPLQIAAGRRWPGDAIQPKSRTRGKGELTPELLSTAVMRYLDDVETCNPEPESEQTEVHVIRSQKDTAAELFRSAKADRVQRGEWYS